MDIIHCNTYLVDLAVNAMVTIKCTDGLPIELATSTAMTTFLENPFNHLLIAVDASKTVGYLIAYELQRPDREQSMMFLYDITVIDEYRKRGIGTALVEKLKSLCTTKPMMKMFVPTNRSNISAVGLYQKTGAIPSNDIDEVFLTWDFDVSS
ncbi:GNAT family N-acetyltransferase [Anaerocolumna sedimenticola]|uniref:GNAT family N-acetyltransferase n=1 Tax=Anaerocolumna sedimenticola TaxID=2696063 RepID=A0A6P1TV78_9FIRM|nr:GNAT family N-acetyltransferase [Anaerocolumna sedimenticola]QHQ63388.1 GNAT family N-acetyltransferase [Anaerocolumna sedimenticola]